MRYLAILFTTLLLFSCSENMIEIDPCELMDPCEGECLFKVDKTEATTYYLTCFDRWGVLYDNGNEFQSGLIIDNMPDEFKKADMSVMLCGYARTNELPMTLPDPNIGEVHQFEAVSLVER